MSYQDAWIGGKATARGYRECADRYEVVRQFCSGFGRPFTVCDIGANMCYFGLRLTEDFPDCTVIAFECDHFEMRAAHVAKAKQPRLRLFERRLSLPDLEALSRCCSFDVVLALSVLHHLPGDQAKWLAAMRAMGENVIAEFALADSARATKRGAFVPSDAMRLGVGASHLRPGTGRPIMLIPGRSQA